jgi:AraC family ethanolamine operon transcriptional activator
LQTGFNQVMGLSPLSYVKAVRLNNVRGQLLQQQTVTDAATQFGFWHFGHFARDYQKMFGEKPSQTLLHFSKN